MEQFLIITWALFVFEAEPDWLVIRSKAVGEGERSKDLVFSFWFFVVDSFGRVMQLFSVNTVNNRTLC